MTSPLRNGYERSYLDDGLNPGYGSFVSLGTGILQTAMEGQATDKSADRAFDSSRPPPRRDQTVTVCGRVLASPGVLVAAGESIPQSANNKRES